MLKSCQVDLVLGWDILPLVGWRAQSLAMYKPIIIEEMRCVRLLVGKPVGKGILACSYIPSAF